LLPGLFDEGLQNCIHVLSAIDFETKDDLHYVKEEGLVEFKRPIQCRKLLNAWTTKDVFYLILFKMTTTCY